MAHVALDMEASDVVINNQNTEITTRRFTSYGSKWTAGIHHNRVFVVKGEPTHIVANNMGEREPLIGNDNINDNGNGGQTPDQKPSARQMLVDVVLRLQTTVKYRALNASYFVFRLLDNLMFLGVILVVVSKAVGFSKLELSVPDEKDIAVMVAIGVELYYDVMLLCNQYWFLQRVSVWVGLQLFGVYFAIVIWIGNTMFIALVTVRFAAFLLEELLDVAIDIEMHNDIIDLFRSPQQAPAARHTGFRGWVMQLLSVSPELFSDFDFVPGENFFHGSFLGWLPTTTECPTAAHAQGQFSKMWRLLFVVPVLLLFPFMAALLLLAAGPCLIMHLIAMCKGTHKALWKEMQGW